MTRFAARSRALPLQALLLATSVLAPVPAVAQPAAPASVPSGASEAVRVLLEQANFWRSQYQDEKADESLRRVLVLDPGNPDALAMRAQAAADAGDAHGAEAALSRLKAARPDDPRIAGVEQSIRTGPIDGGALSLARDLAKAGKPDDAIAAYRRAFKAETPPAALATEFYETLGGSSEDWTVARAGLAGLLRANPDNLRAQLGYAELLTYHMETRDEGFARLTKLAQNPAIAERANKDIRQSLLWLAVGRESLPKFEVYLASHPDDQEIARLAAAAKANTGDLRSAGYAALQDGELDEAVRNFEASLADNPTDSDSLIGLALVRLRQHRTEEGRDLIRQAIAIDPSKAETNQALLRDQPGAMSLSDRARVAAAGRIAQLRIRGQYARVAALADAGEFAQAEALLRKLGGRVPNAATQTYLADLQARAGRLTEAEAGYRAVLARNPRSVQALGGLAGVLAREDRPGESDDLYARAAALPGSAAIGAAHAEALRRQAQRTGDPVAQEATYRAAVAADPGNPWLRLELARLLLSRQDGGGARAVMAPLASNPRANVDALQASIYFAGQVHDDALVAALVARLPPGARAPQILAVAANAQTRSEIREAQALGAPAGERDRLLRLALRPDPSGQRVAAYANELIRAGDKPAAREAVRLALASNPATAEQRVTYAGALLGAGYPADARRITQSVSPADGTLAEQLRQVRDGAAVATSDKLNAAGDPAAAYDALSPRLTASPGNTDLNLALARLYASNRQGDKAVRITQSLLRQKPDSLAVRSSAVYAKLAAGETGQAYVLAQASTRQFPDEPQAWLDLANVERARGHSGQALQALEAARSLRAKQLAEPDRAAAIEDRRLRYAANTPADLATDAGSGDAPELVTRRYAPYDSHPAGQIASAELPIEGGPATSPMIVSGYAPYVPRAPIGAETTAQNDPALDVPAGNPFHPGSSPLPVPDEPASPATAPSRAPSASSPDALTAQIDQGIQQVKQDLAPRLDASVFLRGRTGTPGFERLLEFGVPLEASYSPGGFGRLKVVVTPTYLYSGTSNDAYDLGRFGTNALGAFGPAAARVRTQSAAGSALDVGYAYDIVTADIGASPLGFREQNVVGGLQVSPKLWETATLQLLVERRAVTDSILSYGGLRDSRTGQEWGGVTRSRGHIQLDGTIGLAQYFVGGGGGYLAGDKVAGNSEYDAAIGATYPVWRTATQEVRTGAEFFYFGYDKNLSGFSLGQGGYFSPQQFYAILFPLTWRDQVTPALRIQLGGSAGYQSFHSKNSDVFPNDAGLQAQLVASAATTGASTTVAGSHGSGIAGGVNGEVDYRVRPNLHIGARAGFDHSGDFSEGTGLVYARYILDDTL